jgi:hypothetical protein
METGGVDEEEAAVDFRARDEGICSILCGVERLHPNSFLRLLKRNETPWDSRISTLGRFCLRDILTCFATSDL